MLAAISKNKRIVYFSKANLLVSIISESRAPVRITSTSAMLLIKWLGEAKRIHFSQNQKRLLPCEMF